MTLATPDFLDKPDLTVEEATAAVTHAQNRTNGTVAGVFYDPKAERRAGIGRVLSILFTIVTVAGLVAIPVSMLTQGYSSPAPAIAGGVTVVAFILALVFGRMARTEWFSHDLESTAGFFTALQDDDDTDARWEGYAGNARLYSKADMLAHTEAIIDVICLHVDPDTEATLIEAINSLPLPDPQEDNSTVSSAFPES